MIGENIQFFRKAGGMTQEGLAEKVGVSRQTIAKWEAGESTPDLALARKLANTLDVTLDELTGVPYEKVRNASKSDAPKSGKHLFGLVTVGEKGQIVIPVQARRIFGIEPGDQLMVLGDEDRGLALIDARFFIRVAEVIEHERK